MRLVPALCLFVALLAAPFAQAQDQVTTAIQIADQAHQLLQLLTDDANFAAQGAIGVGDADGWQRYVAFSNDAGGLAYSFDNASRDLGNGLPLVSVAQDYAFSKSKVRDLQLAYARLTQPAFDLTERYQAFLQLEAQFEAAITVPPPNPNDEPDVSGNWQCTAQWSMYGTFMQFQGTGNSRNAAKAAALAQCQQRFTQFCQLGACQLLGGR